MRYFICLIILTGCGSVDVMMLDDDGGVAGTGGESAIGAAGTSGAAGADTGSGVGGSAGSAPQGGTGGGPDLLPLGSSCTTDAECGSGVCDMRIGTGWTPSYTCCTGNRDSCNTCVNGQLVPKPDGSKCAPTTCGDDTTALVHVCQTGACVGEKRFSCTTCNRDAKCGSKPGETDKVCGVNNFNTTVCTPS